MRDGEVDAIDPETAEEKETLEVGQAFLVLAGERVGFGCILVIPLVENGMEMC